MDDTEFTSGAPLNYSVVSGRIENTFANVLKTFENVGEQNPFDIIKQFVSIASSKALQTRDELFENPDNKQIAEEFESWDLETKLWHLVEVLYSFRLSINSGNVNPIEEWDFSSDVVKETNFKIRNSDVSELSLLKSWLQYNSETVDTSEVPMSTKWKNSKKIAETKDLTNLLDKNGTSMDQNNYIEQFDSDAPLRSGKSVHPSDEEVDSTVFKVIYHLILADKSDEAITIANDTGNFTLSMILAGDNYPYLDPIIDKKFIDEQPIKIDSPMGIKHKLMWYQTVYKLAQQTNLNKYEKLIYNFLSGSNIEENLNETQKWEDWLLIYCQQTSNYELLKFYQSLYNKVEDESLPVMIPAPQVTGIENILNIIASSGSKLAHESYHPIRIVAGGAMINKISPLLKSITGSSSLSSVQENPLILRVLTHLIIFLNIIDAETFDPVVFTQVLTSYISYLSKNDLTEIVPTYLTFIPSEHESRECYAEFLSNIQDPEERAQQIKIAKEISYFNDPVDTGSPQVDSNDDRMAIVLRRTVEKIISETEPHYRPSSQILLQDDMDSVDDIDQKLTTSVDWFIDNRMFEDTISVSLVIIKRFLLCGKLAALRKFSEGKRFGNIITSYDNEIRTKLFTNSTSIVSDEQREELLNYDSFIQGVRLIGEWKQFINDNKVNGSQAKGKDLTHSIEKTVTKLRSLIFKWFVGSNDDIFKEFRILYIPYLTIELLQIYQLARLNDRKYLNDAFEFIKQVVDEDQNDLLTCFTSSGRLDEFCKKCGEFTLAVIDKGISPIFI